MKGTLARAPGAQHRAVSAAAVVLLRGRWAGQLLVLLRLRTCLGQPADQPDLCRSMGARHAPATSRKRHAEHACSGHVTQAARGACHVGPSQGFGRAEKEPNTSRHGRVHKITKGDQTKGRPGTPRSFSFCGISRNTCGNGAARPR